MHEKRKAVRYVAYHAVNLVRGDPGSYRLPRSVQNLSPDLQREKRKNIRERTRLLVCCCMPIIHAWYTIPAIRTWDAAGVEVEYRLVHVEDRNRMHHRFLTRFYRG